MMVVAPMNLSHVTLVLGGARSGKSGKAEQLIEERPAPWYYIATAEAHDDEMRERIAEHKARRGATWRTLDAPVALADAIAEVPADAPLLIDCLTLWLSNLMLADHDVEAATEAVLAALAERDGKTVIVSNETGLGIVPDNALARAFRDAQGRLNQRIAAAAGHVVFMVAGLPIDVK